jgi:uncharacterized protein YgfB (UPF0149 family)
MKKQDSTCQQPDRHVAKLKCGYPFPCPYHTPVINMAQLMKQMYSDLTREQVEGFVTGMIQDKVDGVNAQRLLDHDATQRERIAELEAADEIHLQLHDTARQQLADLHIAMSWLAKRVDQLTRELAEAHAALTPPTEAKP